MTLWVSLHCLLISMCPVSMPLSSGLCGCVYTSIVADLIALSVVTSVGACGGPCIQPM